MRLCEVILGYTQYYLTDNRSLVRLERWNSGFCGLGAEGVLGDLGDAFGDDLDFPDIIAITFL